MSGESFPPNFHANSNHCTVLYCRLCCTVVYSLLNDVYTYVTPDDLFFLSFFLSSKKKLPYPRPYSSLARDFDPLSGSAMAAADGLGMDNSRSYLGGSGLDSGGLAGIGGLRDTAINSLDHPHSLGGAASVAATDYDRNRYLASRRFVVGKEWESSWWDEMRGRMMILRYHSFGAKKELGI